MSTIILVRLILAALLILGAGALIWFLRRMNQKLDEEERADEGFSPHQFPIALPHGLQKGGCVFVQEEFPRD